LLVRRTAIPNPGSTVALTIFLLLANVGSGLYAANRRHPSEAFLWICYLVGALLIAYWVLADSRRLGVPGSVDQGLYLFAVWPLALPYYVFKTRRGRGFVTLAGFAALFLATYVLSVFVALAFRVPRR
jgi:hypothetical protein